MHTSFKKIYILTHLIIPIFLCFLTLLKIEKSLIFPYLFLTILSISTLVINCTSPFDKYKPKFLYLFSAFVILGCWFKFSIYKLFALKEFREPIGSFALGSNSESHVLWICSVGIIAILASSILYKVTPKLKKRTFIDDSKNHKAAIVIFITTIFFSFINLKYNILLFAIKPDIILPFKGNVIFFLMLTRALPFLFLYYCLREFNLFYIFIGSLIFSISSIGVLSRLGILIYFIIILLLTLQNIRSWSLTNSIKNILTLAIIFTFSTFINVSIATGARDYLMANASSTTNSKIESAVLEVVSKSTDNDKFKILKDLALGRWIGTEGIMAVVAYPKRGFKLLNEAFKEESYHGDSFYSKILNISNSRTSKVVSTSVPGPIAFYYYSNSLLFVFFAILISTSLFVLIEKGLISLYGGFNSAIALVISFIAFDYHQFGIAPLAFSKYCIVTVLGAIVFNILCRINFNSKRINKE